MPATPTPLIPVAQVLALVLAGGRATRMGGDDKGLLPWGDATLATHAADRLRTQGFTVQVSANRNPEHYTAKGLMPLADLRAGFAGPLAALEAGLARAQETGAAWLLAVPCDCPHFPACLPDRLLAAAASAKAAFAVQNQGVHPAFCVLSVALAGTLTRYLDDGGRRMRDWWTMVDAARVDFSDQPADAFANANTPEDLARLRRLAGLPAC